jgi:hypothetical protein
MKHLEGYNSWTVRSSIKRGGIPEKQKFYADEITRHLEDFWATKDDEIRLSLLRWRLDSTLREFHKTLQPHYDVESTREFRTFGEKMVVEHIVPANCIIDLLTQEQITVKQACHMPLCMLPQSLDNVLNMNGYKSTTPCPYRFLERYTSCFSNDITMVNGTVLDASYTLDDHFELYLPEE